ncbi:MAG: cytochrome b [Robiginitomaculum sp.]|nr:cytochrome b [Robiginitomaculum sp.]
MAKSTMTDTQSYNKIAVLLHWGIGGLIVLLLAFGFLMDNIPKDNLSLRVTVFNWHKTIGLLILVLSVFRLVWKLTHKAPAPLRGVKPWEKLVSKTVHALFYVFMIGMPLVGWAMISTSRFPSYLFNWAKLRIPEMPFWQGLEKSAKHDVNEFFEETHELMAFAAIALILLHVFAALKHHKAGKDILVRMMPGYTRKTDQ